MKKYASLSKVELIRLMILYIIMLITKGKSHLNRKGSPKEYAEF